MLIAGVYHLLFSQVHQLVCGSSGNWLNKLNELDDMFNTEHEICGLRHTF